MLLTRTFDRNYIVKYLGIPAFAVYDGVQTLKSAAFSSVPEKGDLEEVLAYVSGNHAAPNRKMFGLAKGRNLIMIHMESIQQFLIDYNYTDNEGRQWEVLPFLNELYHSPDSISFSNLFTQVGQGKSSDAELMMETSLFGLHRGAAFVKNADNTYYALPHILRCKAGYTSAAFHGNSGSFWNRNDMYQHLGYEYFFDAGDFMLTEENSTEYGLKDKLFKQSVRYFEHLQQPFTPNSSPCPTIIPFPMMKTMIHSSGRYIGRFCKRILCHLQLYRSALEEFFNYLKSAGIYENSIIVLYGDHYGISDSRNKTLAPLLGRDEDSWTEFDDAQMKRVPLIIHIPGYGKGFESDIYAGQIDVLPTLLHLLGIDTQPYILMGQDLFRPVKGNCCLP